MLDKLGKFLADGKDVDINRPFKNKGDGDSPWWRFWLDNAAAKVAVAKMAWPIGDMPLTE